MSTPANVPAQRDELWRVRYDLTLEERLAFWVESLDEYADPTHATLDNEEGEYLMREVYIGDLAAMASDIRAALAYLEQVTS